MKEFASFPKATQRYIRRSLDVAYGRSDPMETWARDEIEAAAIAAQARFYKQLDHLRLQIPDDSGLDMIEPFLGMLVTLAAFDLGQDRIQNFAAFRSAHGRRRKRSNGPPITSPASPSSPAWPATSTSTWTQATCWSTTAPTTAANGKMRVEFSSTTKTHGRASMSSPAYSRQ
jgi:hypothetical protein